MKKIYFWENVFWKTFKFVKISNFFLLFNFSSFFIGKKLRNFFPKKREIQNLIKKIGEKWMNMPRRKKRRICDEKTWKSEKKRKKTKKNYVSLSNKLNSSTNPKHKPSSKMIKVNKLIFSNFSWDLLVSTVFGA